MKRSASKSHGSPPASDSGSFYTRKVVTVREIAKKFGLGHTGLFVTEEPIITVYPSSARELYPQFGE